jgi:hypothetical protein
MCEYRRGVQKAAGGLLAFPSHVMINNYFLNKCFNTENNSIARTFCRLDYLDEEGKILRSKLNVWKMKVNKMYLDLLLLFSPTKLQ